MSKTTPLTGWHQARGAKMAEFAGYLMPMEYEGILAEHRAVRTRVGMFDVSHMGIVDVHGSDAAAFMNRVLANRPGRLNAGRALYSPMCADDGGAIDDVICYRVDRERFFIVVNAANRLGDVAHLRRAAEGMAVGVRDVSDDTALVAVQGPAAWDVLGQAGIVEGPPPPRFGFRYPVSIGGAETLVARTGYTGEDGAEIACPASAAAALFERLARAGVPPIGLGARDTLRLEAALPLYGHELSRTIDPLTAGLGAFVRLQEGGFLGAEALRARRDAGLDARLVGLVLEGAGIARHGYRVTAGEVTVGRVTSGTFAPTVGRAVALALLWERVAQTGRPLTVWVRGRGVPARVVPTPFYRRPAAMEKGGAHGISERP